MSALGLLACEATEAYLSTMPPPVEGGTEARVYYCAAKRIAANFSWKCVQLSFSPVPSPVLAPRVGIELAATTVGNLMGQDRGRCPPDERLCFFCQETVALDDEYFVYHYRAASTNNLHFLVVAHFCAKASCKGEADAWRREVRKSAPPTASHRVCSQCGASDVLKAKFLACRRCLLVNYCSTTCQKQHWKTHRPFCQIVPED